MSEVVRKFWPVAEYLGIGICEREGDKRAVWRGGEYRIDGQYYIFRRKAGDFWWEGVESERIVKLHIDKMTPRKRRRYLSMIELLEIMKDPLIELVRKHPERYRSEAFRWDEETGLFVPKD